MCLPFIWRKIEPELCSELLLRILQQSGKYELLKVPFFLLDLHQSAELHNMPSWSLSPSRPLRYKLPLFPSLLLQIRSIFYLHYSMPITLLCIYRHREMLKLMPHWLFQQCHFWRVLDLSHWL